MITKRLLAGALLLCAMVTGLSGGQRFPAEPGDAVKSGEYIVKFKSGANPSAILNGANPALKLVPGPMRQNIGLVRLPENGQDTGIDRLAQDPGVEWVEPNRIRTTQIQSPADTSYATQWALATVEAAKAWSLLPGRYFTAATVGSSRIKVAVLDTGFDCGHPDFRNRNGATADSAGGGQVALGLSQAPVASRQPGCNVQDDHGHGTHVAGTIAAATDNGVGVSSLGYPLELIIYKVLDAQGNGDDMTIASAIEAAADAGARIISMSLGGSGYSQTMQDAIRYAWERDTLVVAASGNYNSSSLFYPAGSNLALAVAATDSSNLRASFSNFGGAIGVAAPGVHVLSTFPSYNLGSGTTSYATMSGTSMATPHVSALAGLVATATPGLSVTGIVQQIQRTASSTLAGGGWGTLLGYGIINAHHTLSSEWRPAAYGSIYGQVTNTAHVPLSGVTVSAGGVTMTTGAYGLFRLANIPPGQYTLTAASSAHGSTARPVVVLGGADTPFPVVMGEANVGTISGTISDGDGPVAGATVQILRSGLVQQVVLTNAAGQYSALEPAGSYGLRATSYGHVPATLASLSLASGATVTANLTMPKYGTISGTVRDSVGNPVGGAQISVQSGSIRAGAVTDAQGRYTTLGVPAGTYSVTVTAGQFGTFTINSVAVGIGATATANFTVEGQSFVVTPGIASASSGTTVQFAVTTGGGGAGAPDVTWSISPNIGSINSNGLYTAPVTSAASTVTVTATGDSGTSASATLLINGKVTLTLGAATVVGGTSINNSRVTISSPAPAAGISISLVSSRPAVSLPVATVAIAAGATSTTFSIPTTPVGDVTTVVYTATAGDLLSNASVSIQPPALLGLSLGNTELTSGQILYANSVWLTGPAAAGGMSATLTSSDPAANPPSTVTIAEGSNSSPLFNIPTSPVPTDRTVTITVRLGDKTETASFLLKRTATALDLTLAASSVPAGSPLPGNTVTLSAPAPASGALVTLSSSNPGAATVPASLLIPAGATSGTFAIGTGTVTTNTNVSVTASYGGASSVRSLTVTAAAADLDSLILSASSAVGPATVPNNRVTLTSAAPSTHATVTLRSSNTAAVVVPGSIVVAAGQTVSGAFEMQVKAVTTATPVTITATYGTTSRIDVITVQPPQSSTLSSFSISSSLAGGAVGAARVILSENAPAGGATVHFTSSHPTLVPAPAPVLVPAGQTTVNFDLPTKFTSVQAIVTLTATVGESARVDSVTIRPLALSAMVIATTTTAGGNALVNNRVTLDGPAPAGGATVTFTSSHPNLVPTPDPITVPEGQTTSALFTLPTNGAPATASVTITGSYNGSAKTDVVEIRQATISSMIVAASSVVAGISGASNRVILDAPAPAGGARITFTSSLPAAVPAPAPIMVPAGQTVSEYFTIVTNSVDSPAIVTITAEWNGSTKSDVLEIRPPALTMMIVSYASIAGGLTAVNNRAVLDGPAPESGALITFTSSHPALVPAPEPVMVAPGQNTSPFFSLLTAPVAVPVDVTITAAYKGSTRSDDITIRPPALISFTVSPTTVTGGTPTSGSRVVLDGPAPAGGVPVTFLSSNPAAVPAPVTVIVPAGQVLAAVPIDTNPVALAQSVTLSATANGAVKTAILNLAPIAN